jgi:hypothetical protein
MRPPSPDSLSILALGATYIAFILLLLYVIIVNTKQKRPTVLWSMLKGKKVKSNDGKDQIKNAYVV